MKSEDTLSADVVGQFTIEGVDIVSKLDSSFDDIDVRSWLIHEAKSGNALRAIGQLREMCDEGLEDVRITLDDDKRIRVSTAHSALSAIEELFRES